VGEKKEKRIKKMRPAGPTGFPTSLLVRTGFRRPYILDVETTEEGHSLRSLHVGWNGGAGGNGMWAWGKSEKGKERALRLRLGPCNEEYGIYFVQLG